MTEIVNDCLSGLNRLGNAFSSCAANTFLQSALLVILLFGIDLLVRKRVRAVFRHGVWLLVLVKLVLPPTLALPTGIGYWLGDRLPAASPVSEHFVDTGGFDSEWQRRPANSQRSGGSPPVQPPANAAEPDAPVAPAVLRVTPITWQGLILLFWLAGVLAFAALLAQRVRFVKGLVAASAAAEGELLSVLDQCRRQMGVRRPVELRTSDAVPSPAVCGLLGPTILMPAVLVKKLSPEGLRAALIHELAHIKRGDLWVNSVQTLLQVIHFYNPFVWFANAIIRRTCEEAVDETVLVTLGGEAKNYSNTLIDIGEMAFWKADFGLRLIGVAESRKALHWRIKHMLTRPVPKSARIGALGTITIILAATVLLPMARAERSNKEASAIDQAPAAGTGEKAPAAGESDVLVDSKTGVKFVLAKTISGANNLIEHVNKLTLSPDGRFLLWFGRVVPLDGSEAFCYTESSDGREVAVSPNGRYIAHGEKAVWLQPVSPETLRPNSPAKKLLDLKGGQLVQTWGRPAAIGWTRDSETIFFNALDAEGKSEQYAFSAATGVPVSFPDAMARGLLSPDGKCVALTDGNAGFWVKPVGEGAARNLCGEGPAPLCWSGDGRWLIGAQPDGRGARFARYPEGQEYLVPLPGELANSSLCVGTSADKKRLFFYQAGYDLKFRVKVASAADGTVRDVDVKPPYVYFETFQWAPDRKAILIAAYTARGEGGLLESPLSGEEQVRFAIKPETSGEVTPFSASPDGKWLLFAVTPQPDTGTFDFGVAPLSMANHEVSGLATVVFRNARHPGGTFVWVWSPDSTRVALISKDDTGGGKGIWIASTDGKAPLRLTQTTATERDLTWSPDGSMLAFVSDSGGVEELKAVPTAGGETRVIREWASGSEVAWGWSPDSKSLTIAEDDMLVRQPLSGDKAESIVNLKESGVEWTSWLSWSPDGSRLALICNKPGSRDLRAWGRLLFARIEGSRLQQTATADLRGGNWHYAWSPDSTHVAYTCEDAAAVRPAGRLYALSVDDVLERISAGAITPTRTQTAASVADGKPTESKAAPKAEPIPGPVFTDNFDNGPSKHWLFQDSPEEGLGPGRHAVENGQLMLSHARACLDGIDWTDYIVTVRVCLKESAASGEGVFGITARATPSQFGSGRKDRYQLLFLYVNNAPRCLLLDLNYVDASDTLRHGRLSESPCNIVRDKWYTLELEVRGQQLRGFLDGKLAIEATDARLSKGGVWLNTWRCRVLFDDFSVRQLP